MAEGAPQGTTVEVDEDRLVEALAAGDDISSMRIHGFPPLSYSLFTYDLDLFEQILTTAPAASLEHAGEGGFTPLLFAAQEGLADIAQRLIEAGANMETETVDREVWQRFRQGGETALSIAASNGKAEVVRVLLAAGAKIDARDSCGNSPMAAAVQAGRLECAALLRFPGDEYDMLTGQPDGPLGDDGAVSQIAAKASEDQRALEKRFAALAAGEKAAQIARVTGVAVTRPQRVVIVPGVGCVPAWSANWYPWLAEALAREGFAVVYPWDDMPSANRSTKTEWIPFVRETLGVDAATILVGHSAGGDTVLRLLETEAVAGAIVVSAGPVPDDDPDPEDPDFGLEDTLSLHYDPWQWDAIKANAGWLVQFHSADDDIVAVDEGRAIAAATGSEYNELEVRGHFLAQTMPEVLATILDRAAPASSS